MGVISNGTTLLDGGSLDSGVPSGALVLIKTLTASNSGDLSFVNGSSSVVFDGTYKEYIFKFLNIHPATDGQQFRFQTSTNGGSSYATTLTSTYFNAYHKEDGSEQALGYITGSDQAQTTNFKVLGSGDNENDSGISGQLTIFDPASTTFVKHFFARTINDPSGYAQDEYTAGMFNTTSALNAIQFKFASGNIDSGIIKMYGVK
tara:strand:+ start:354 stop:965 length:612 start_codon:yes stop_codon:yes gene_type:complete